MTVMTNSPHTRLVVSLIASLTCVAINSGCSGDDDWETSSAVAEDGGASDAATSEGKSKGGVAGGSAGKSAEVAAAGSRAARDEGSAGSASANPEEGSSGEGASASASRPSANAAADAARGEDGGGGSVKGIVVDGSNGNAMKNFDHTMYPSLAGVRVCVYEHAEVPCAVSDSEGRYTLAGLPKDLDVYLTYEKDSFAPMLWKPVSGTGDEMPAMFMLTREYRDAFAKAGRIEPDDSTGLIYFGAHLLESRGTMVHQKFGTQERYYLRAYSLSVAPAAKAGPVYVSSHGSPDANLTVASAAGWGIVQAVPGDYTLSYEHPSLSCPTVEAKVVKGFITAYVSVVCSVGDADAGI